MADESHQRDIEAADEADAAEGDTNAAADVNGADSAASSDTSERTAEDAAVIDGPVPSPSDDARRGGRAAQLAAGWRSIAGFWRFIVGVSALSVAALLVLAVIAAALAIFDDDHDHDHGWFAYAPDTGLAAHAGLELVPEDVVFHNGAGRPFHSDHDYSDSVRDGDCRRDVRRDKAGKGPLRDYEGELRHCRAARRQRFLPRSDFGDGVGHCRGGQWPSGAAGPFGHRRPAPSFHGFGFGGGELPFGFFNDGAEPFGLGEDGFGGFGFSDRGTSPPGGPFLGLPGPLGLIPGVGDAELSELLASCAQLRAAADDRDADAGSAGQPQIGLRELVLAVICPADDPRPPLFGDDDHATDDSRNGASDEDGDGDGDEGGVGDADGDTADSEVG